MLLVVEPEDTAAQLADMLSEAQYEQLTADGDAARPRSVLRHRDRIDRHTHNSRHGHANGFGATSDYGRASPVRLAMADMVDEPTCPRC
jgi:hypothetical protein